MSLKFGPIRTVAFVSLLIVSVIAEPSFAGIVLPTPDGTASTEGERGRLLACGFVAGGTDLNGLCGPSAGFGSDELTQLSPFQQQAISEAARQAQSQVSDQLTGDAGRLGQIRNLSKLGKPSGFTFNGRQIALSGLYAENAAFRGTGGGAAVDSSPLGGRLGAFLNVKYGSGEQDANASEAGFDFNVIGVLAGVDYRFTDRFVGGISLGYNRTDSDYIGVASGSEFEINNYSFSLYGSFYPTDTVYLDFLATLGRNNYATERAFALGQKADGDTDGNQYALSATAGYQFSHQALTFGPYMQVNWQRAEVDKYTETGTGFALTVNDQTLKSFTSVVGVSADYAISMDFGVLTPSLRVEWEHEFSNDSRVIVAQFASDPGSFMNLPTAAPDRNFFNVGVGVSTTLPRGITAFADFEVLLGHEDLDNHTVTVGARMEF